MMDRLLFDKFAEEVHTCRSHTWTHLLCLHVDISIYTVVLIQTYMSLKTQTRRLYFWHGDVYALVHLRVCMCLGGAGQNRPHPQYSGGPHILGTRACLPHS